MKKILQLLLVVLFTSCSSPDNEKSYNFRNNTNFSVVVSPYVDLLEGAPYFEFEIPPYQAKTYTSNNDYSAFDIKSHETQRIFIYNFQEDVRVISSFENMVLYKITGTAKSADLTYVNSDGSTSQTTVSLPCSIGFDSFVNNFKYISAQNNTDVGTIRVELFIKDVFISGKTCGSSYCIATTHN